MALTVCAVSNKTTTDEKHLIIANNLINRCNQFTFGQSRANAISSRNISGTGQHATGGLVSNDGVAAIQCGERADGIQRPTEQGNPVAGITESPIDRRRQALTQCREATELTLDGQGRRLLQ